MKSTPAQTCRRAASILEVGARDLRRAHTLRGRWVLLDDIDRSAKAEHDRDRALARELRRIANGRRRH